MQLEQDVTAYDKSNIYDADVNILSRAYPKRIVEILSKYTECL